MRESRRNNLLVALAALLIVGTIVLYAALVSGWLSRGTSRTASPLPAAAPKELAAARLSFRDNFLDPKSHLGLSEALYRLGRPVDAFYVLLFARGFFGDEAFSRAHDLIVLHRDEFLDSEPFDPSPENEERLKARLQDDPDNPAVLAYLSRIARRRHDIPRARKYLAAGLAAHPQDRWLLSGKSDLAALSEPLEAIPLYARLAHASPDSYEGRSALDALGRLAQKRGDGPDAETARLAREALEELLRAHPTQPLVFSTLAMALWARGDAGPVKAMVDEALSRHPDHAGALMVDGALALQDGRIEKALQDFTAAWEKNPDDVYSAAKLAQIYLKQRGDRESALPYYLALYRRNPSYADPSPAEQTIREILDPRREEVLKGADAAALGRVLGSEDAALRAQACVRAAESRDPRFIEALAGLLDDDTDIVRHNADYALYQMARSHPESVRARRDDWLKDASPLKRTRVLGLFADLFPKETLPLVLEALEDPRPAVRYLTKTLVLDPYYRDLPEAAKARAAYLASEKNPAVLALYDLKKPRGN